MNPPSSVDALVRRFVELIAASWSTIERASELTNGSDYRSDWLQGNWELVVEAGLPPGVFLEVYGDGADCNDGSSRVCMPNACATHAVVVLATSAPNKTRDLLSGDHVVIGSDGLAVEEFVTIEGGWYAHRPPFDCALVETPEGTRVFRNDDVTFALGKAVRG